MKRKDEEFAKLQFDKFLQMASPNTRIRWEEVEQQNEPPDYHLYLNSKKFAVEVTTLMEKVEVGNRKLPHLAILASLWKLVDEVEATAINENYLHGAYVVRFSKPIINFKHIKEQLYQDLLIYVQSTQSKPNEPEHTVFEDGRQKCTIEKLDNQPNYIGKMGPTGGKWEGEIVAEICDLLTERINVKKDKLKNVVFPTILLLHDLYHFAKPQMYKTCLSTFTYLLSFHTIFVTQSNETGFILFSANQEWLQKNSLT